MQSKKKFFDLRLQKVEILRKDFIFEFAVIRFVIQKNVDFFVDGLYLQFNFKVLSSLEV